MRVHICIRQVHYSLIFVNVALVSSEWTSECVCVQSPVEMAPLFSVSSVMR